MSDEDEPPTTGPTIDHSLEEFDPPDFPEEREEFDFRDERAWEGEESEEPNPHILALTNRYLEDRQVATPILKHIPTLVFLAAIRVADRRNAQHPVHFFGPDIPFRYTIHLTQLGSSGFYKGATVEEFFRIVGKSSSGAQPVFETNEYKGGSLESLRGGVAQLGGQRAFQLGGIERSALGFVYVPEFTQLAELGEKSKGAIQSIIAWADTAGKMVYDTISGGFVEYHAPSSLILGLQTAKLTDVEDVVLGWNRRSIYDKYAPLDIDEVLSANRKEALPTDPFALKTLREAYEKMIHGWKPERIDWTPFREWMDRAYLGHLAVPQDEQMLYSIALGYHIATGRRWTGVVPVGVPPDLHRILERILFYKRLARINPTVRAAHDAKYVLTDRHVLGQGQTMGLKDVKRHVAARLAIDEDLTQQALEHLVEEGILMSVVEQTAGADQTVYKLTGR